jgi:predicted nucleotidyltransferase component of viral defense system
MDRMGRMDRDSVFFRQAELLLRVLPLIHEEADFALKGGTAINFFVRNMPRLSVDIDLTFLPITDRATAYDRISAMLLRLSKRLQSRGTKVVLKKSGKPEFVRAIIVTREAASIKIEPNFIIRGSLYDVETRELCQAAQETFELSVEAQVLSVPDVYGGKICAALDRQHPRDLFDIKPLLDDEGLTDAVRKSFVVHLVSHDRPMAELLDPNFADLKKAFTADFEGMTLVKVSPEELEATRARLVQAIRKDMTDKERRFILSVKKGDPEWELIELEGVDRLPAVQWKLLNVRKMDKAKHRQALRRLEKCFGR